MRLRFTHEAQADLDAILQYSLEQWGELVATDYMSALRELCEQLIDFPLIGRPYPGRRIKARMRRARQHVLIYRVVDDEVQILRIVHGRSDLNRLFGEEQSR